MLVVWQLASGKPTFLPRLGAPIESLAISPDAKLYAIAHSDNAIRLVDAATFQVCVLLLSFSLCVRAYYCGTLYIACVRVCLGVRVEWWCVFLCGAGEVGAHKTPTHSPARARIDTHALAHIDVYTKI